MFNLFVSRLFLFFWFSCWFVASAVWCYAGEVDAALLRSIASPDCSSFLRSSSLSLADYTDWKIYPSKKLDSIKLSKVDRDGWSCLQLGVRGDGLGEKVTIALRSELIASQPYSSVDAISLAMKGGTHGYLRVILRDSRGNLFSSRSAPSTAFEGWTNFTLSTRREAVQFFQGDQSISPPVFIEKVVVVLPSFDGDVSLLLSEIDVWSRSGPFQDEKSTRVRWFGNICSEPIAGRSVRQVLKMDNKRPIEVGNILFVKIDARGLGGESLALELAHYGHGKKVVLEKAISKGNELVSHKLKMDDPGLYAVVSSIYSAEGEILDRTSRQVLVWDPPGNQYEDNIPTFFGMMYHDKFPKKRAKDLDLIRQAGVKVVRFQFRWSDVEKRPGVLYWIAYDGIMSDLKKRGFIAQPMVFYTPAWAGGNVTSPRDKKLAQKRPQWVAPAFSCDLAAFIAAAAKRYAGQPAVWEVWNEPTERQHWIGGDVHDYMEVLQAVCSRVPISAEVGVNSAGMVGISASSKDFAKVVARQSCALDTGFAVHAYSGPASMELNIRKVMDDLGNCSGQKGIWVNESGFLVDPFDPVGEIVRSENMVKMYTVARYFSVANLTWFLFRNYEKSALSGADNFSIVAYNETIRPPLAAYAGLVKRLAGTTPVSRSGSRDGIVRYDFESNEGRRIVFWADEGRSIVVPDVAGEKIMMKCDMYDFCEEVSPGETVNVESSPVFLLYAKN